MFCVSQILTNPLIKSKIYCRTNFHRETYVFCSSLWYGKLYVELKCSSSLSRNPQQHGFLSLLIDVITCHIIILSLHRIYKVSNLCNIINRKQPDIEGSSKTLVYKKSLFEQDDNRQKFKSR